MKPASILLNIGCGFKKIEGYYNIDVLPETEPDIVLDLNKDRLPFKDGSVSHIRSVHTFEHIKNFEHALEECHRVLKLGRKLHLILPYATNLGGDYEYHTIRPRYWVFKDFEFGCPGMGKGTCKFIIERYIRFPWYTKFLELMNMHVRLVYYYESTGLRYLFPAHEIELKMEKVKTE